MWINISNTKLSHFFLVLTLFGDVLPPRSASHYCRIIELSNYRERRLRNSRAKESMTRPPRPIPLSMTASRRPPPSFLFPGFAYPCCFGGVSDVREKKPVLFFAMFEKLWIVYFRQCCQLFAGFFGQWGRNPDTGKWIPSYGEFSHSEVFES
jgi:hypothetical protein